MEKLNGGDETVLPLAEETLRLGKRMIVETGRVRISVTTETEERLVRETLRGQRAEVERVTLDRELEPGEAVPLARREEDGTLVLPVLEEVLVIERRLVLREEFRMRTVATEETYEATVPLRHQRAALERLPPSTAEHAASDGEATSSDARSAAQTNTTK